MLGAAVEYACCDNPPAVTPVTSVRQTYNRCCPVPLFDVKLSATSPAPVRFVPVLFNILPPVTPAAHSVQAVPVQEELPLTIFTVKLLAFINCVPFVSPTRLYAVTFTLPKVIFAFPVLLIISGSLFDVWFVCPTVTEGQAKELGAIKSAVVDYNVNEVLEFIAYKPESS